MLKLQYRIAEETTWRTFDEVRADKEQIRDALGSLLIEKAYDRSMFRAWDPSANLTHLLAILTDEGMIELPRIGTFEKELLAEPGGYSQKMADRWIAGFNSLSKWTDPDWEKFWNECGNPSWLMALARFTPLKQLSFHYLSINTQFNAGAIDPNNKLAAIGDRIANAFIRYLNDEISYDEAFSEPISKMYGYDRIARIKTTTESARVFGDFLYAISMRTGKDRNKLTRIVRDAIPFSDVAYYAAKAQGTVL